MAVVSGHASFETCGEVPESSLLDLPQHLLLIILQQLDVVSLCATARCCNALLRLASHPILWPVVAGETTAAWALDDVRTVLANLLRLPMQVIPVHLGVGRSRRFLVVVPMHSLRRILATADVESLAETVSRALQCKLDYVSRNLWRYDSWQQLPPAASISLCRADGPSLRAALRPQLVVPRLIHHLQQAGWPQDHLHGDDRAFAANSPLQEPCTCPRPIANSNCKDTSCGNTLLHSSSGSTTCDRPSPESDTGTCDHVSAAPALPVTSQCMGRCRTCPSRNAGMLPPGLMDVLHLCQHRMGLLHNLQLAQLQHMQTGHPGRGTSRARPSSDCSSAGGCAWQPDMATLQKLAPLIPDEAVVRRCVALILDANMHRLNVDGVESPAVSLAVQLFWVYIITQPYAAMSSCVGIYSLSTTSIAFDCSAKPWQKPLQLVAEVAARIVVLQRSTPMHNYSEQPSVGQHWSDTARLPACYNTTDGGQDSVHEGRSAPRHDQASLTPDSIGAKDLGGRTAFVWPAAGAAELQLCLSGLHELLVALNTDDNPKCQPEPFYRCILALKAAVKEYKSSSQPQDAVLLLRGVQGNSETLEQSNTLRLLQGTMLVEVLRALRWCLWLLGVRYPVGEVEEVDRAV